MKTTHAPFASAIGVVAIALAAACDGAASTEPILEPPLARSQWRLAALETGDSLVLAIDPTRIPVMAFGPRVNSPSRGDIGGQGPCNIWGGLYEATVAGSIRVDSLMSSRVGCTGAMAELETAFNTRLLTVSKWAIVGDTLVLTTPDEHSLRFLPY